MKALQKTLAIIAFLFLATQTVRNAYALWMAPQSSVLDVFGRKTKSDIAKATSLDDLVTRYDAAHKEAEKKRQEEVKAGKEPWAPQNYDIEPFKSESELQGSISEWEARAKDIRALHFYWFAGLGFLIIGTLVYAKWNQWLGLTLSIIAFSEFIFWTSPEFFSWARTIQTDRLYANKFGFGVASIMLLLIMIQMQGIFKKKAEA
ncbi:MAG: hypothetical protein LAO20_03285 [Acidobacteriia bacterium]|nr:hypothetical protein [Terriglobia bacterium]